MKINFDREIERRNTDSMKWDALEERFGHQDLIPLWVADMDFEAPEAVKNALKEKVDHGIFGYPKPPTSLQNAITNWVDKRYNWKIQNDWLTYTPGVVPALATAINAFTEIGDGVLIQTPVYYPFYHVIKKNDRKLVTNELINNDGRYEIDFADFEQKIKENEVKMFILCNPHNPSSRVMSVEELKKLGDICLKHDVLIISDEIHSDLILKGYKHTPIASLSEELLQQTITCIAPSKTFNLAGLQAAALIIPNDKLMRTFQSEMQKQGLTVINSLGLTAMEAAYEHGEEWLEQLLEYIENNINYLIEFFEEELPQLKVIKPEGTYLVWIDCRDLGLSKKELENLLLQKSKVALNQGYIFGEEGAGFIRINVACPRTTLEKGLKQVKAGIDQL